LLFYTFAKKIEKIEMQQSMRKTRV